MAAILALHFEKAEAHEKALQYFELAGHRASESYANTEAMAFYESAIVQAEQIRDPAADARIAAAREGLGDVYKRIGQDEAAREQYSQAHDLQLRLPQPDTLLLLPLVEQRGTTVLFDATRNIIRAMGATASEASCAKQQLGLAIAAIKRTGSSNSCFIRGCSDISFPTKSDRN